MSGPNLSDKLAARLTGHRRLVILRCLAGLPAEERERLLLLRLLTLLPATAGNIALLRDLTQDAGAPLVRDRVLAAAHWLEGHGLVMTTRDGDVVGVHLTERGADVAEGRQTWPGVAPLTVVEWLHRRLRELTIAAPLDQVRADTAWLAEQGLVSLHTTGGMLVLTEAGHDVTAGRLVVEGVQKPAAGAALKAAAASAAAILKG